MTTLHRTSAFLSLALVTAMLVACGGGGGGSSPPPGPGPGPGPGPDPDPVAPENPILYIGADNTTGASPPLELYLVDPAAPGESVKVNPTVVAGGWVGGYSLSPDLAQVAYMALQDSLNAFELYIVDLANPGTSTKLNGPLVSGGGLDEFVFSPDGSHIAYIADQEVFGQFELYLVDLANPGVSNRLNPDLPTEGDTFGRLSFSPDGSKILYAADQEVDGKVELFLADVATPGTTTKVNAPIVDGGDVIDNRFAFSPDGATIVYIADQEVDDVRELYAVDVSNPGVSTKLNPALVPEGDLCTFRFSPDSTKVGYCADQDVDGMLELYLVDLAVPGVSMKVNPPLVADGDVQAETFRFGPNSDFIVYRADQDVDGDNELYRVEVATPGVSAKINQTLVAGGDVSIFTINPDGVQLIYVADQDTEGVAELYNVDLSTPGTATKLNPQPVGTQIAQIDITEDGTQVLYTTDHGLPDKYELARIDIASAGVSTRINPELPVTGDVVHFAIRTGLSF
jgi:Tol biopolymer transport system component